ncbi:uncharacterized protein LOC127716300 [Mytilus californianus]|uniref:uncharacterized protein LOC127716300 n=1 Tax=Mytilus californianus TaxID=6549 RepID=UPI0022484F3E|nr:uncharacterized protein LOC127716300 [Mytilus californianus]
MKMITSLGRRKCCFAVITQSFRSAQTLMQTNNKNFLQAISNEDDISNVIRRSLENYTDITLEPYQIIKFSLGKSFTNAGVDIRQIVKDSRGKIIDHFASSEDDKNIYTNQIKFESVFKEGFNALYNTADGKLSKCSKLNFATQAFRTGFLENQDFHERCLEKMFYTDEESELFRTVLLANHLFGRLAANFGQNYFVSQDHRSHDTYNKCPCDECGEKIPYNISGIGSEFLWYGYPDIIVNSIGGSTMIARPEEKDRDEQIAEGDIYFQADFEERQLLESEENIALLRYNRNISKFVAQAVTFSFYQKYYQLKLNKNKINVVPVTLVPTLAVTGTHFDIYLYDHEHDILLRNKGPPIPLWRNEYPEAELEMSSVLKIWMILNHLTLQPSLEENIIQELKGSCQFLHALSSGQKNMIGQTISMRNRFYPRRYTEIDALPLQRREKILNPPKKKDSI